MKYCYKNILSSISDHHYFFIICPIVGALLGIVSSVGSYHLYDFTNEDALFFVVGIVLVAFISLTNKEIKSWKILWIVLSVMIFALSVLGSVLYQNGYYIGEWLGPTVLFGLLLMLPAIFGCYI